MILCPACDEPAPTWCPAESDDEPSGWSCPDCGHFEPDQSEHHASEDASYWREQG